MSHHTIPTRSRPRRPKPTGARFVCTTLGALVILAFVAACSPGGGTPAASNRWDDARWDTARWVAPAASSVSAIAAGNELDAEPVRLALSTVEAEVGALRELVIETRRTQVMVRDRVSALEASVLGPSAHDPAPEVALGDVRTLESVANADLEAGSIASSALLNSVFTVLASDLTNIHEFMVLLDLDSDALAARLVAIEEALDVLPTVPDEPVPLELDPPVVPYVFASGTVMHATEMNENLAAIDSTSAFLDAADEMMARLVEGFLVRVVALEDGTAPFAYAGTWSGTMVDSLAGTGTTTITMSQTGSNLVGTWQAVFPGLDNQGSLTGVVNDDEVTFELHPADPAACSFSGVAQRTGLTLAGAYEAYDCSEAITGAVTVTKQ